MPISHIELTDDWAAWLQKDNDMIDIVNSLVPTGGIVSTTSPASGDILVYDGSIFKNVQINGDATMDDTGLLTITTSGGDSRSRKYYASRSSLLF